MHVYVQMCIDVYQGIMVYAMLAAKTVFTSIYIFKSISEQSLHKLVFVIVVILMTQLRQASKMFIDKIQTITSLQMTHAYNASHLWHRVSRHVSK